VTSVSLPASSPRSRGRDSEITVAESRALLAKAAFDHRSKFLQFLKRTPHFSGSCRFHGLAIISNVLPLRNRSTARRFLSANLIQICGTQTRVTFDRTQSIRRFHGSVLSRVAAQNQPAVAVPNETNQIKQLFSVDLACFIHVGSVRLMPRLKRIKHERLYLSDKGTAGDYPNLAGTFARPIRWDRIEQQYDEMVKSTVAVKRGTATSEAILNRYNSYNVMHPTYKAFAEVPR
jgi:Tn3 transposase DDE domain